MNISLKIGPKIIDSIFDVGNQKDSEEGLKLAEIKENLESFGMDYKDIEKDFEAVDKNGDGLVSKEEGVNAFQTFGLDRGLLDVDASSYINHDYNFELLLYTSESNKMSFKFAINEDLDDDYLDGMYEDFLDQGFDSSRATKIIAHGWKEDATDFYSWYISGYASSGWDINLICINWENHADTQYSYATEYAIAIGEKIGTDIVSKLLLNSGRLNQNENKIHAIGHR